MIKTTQARFGNKYLFAILAIACMILAGCAASTQPINTLQKFDTQKDSRTEKIQQIAVTSATVDAKSDYQIGPDDSLDIDIFQDEQVKKTVRVSAKGYIGLPLVGQVYAKGLTAAQLESELATKFSEYYVDPTVSVFVREYRGHQIGVMGAVKQPQVYSVTGQKKLLDILALAGGLAPEAGYTAYVMRPKENGTETIVISLSELLDEGNIALNIPVYGEDMINIPKGGVVFVDGLVTKPGAYPINPKTTLSKVIAMAGGVTWEGSTDVKLYRNDGAGVKQIASVDYDAIKDGSAQDFQMKEGDVVIVPRNGFRSVLSVLGGTFRGAVSIAGPAL